MSGAFAGLLAGLFGVGGGIILVPALFYVFDELGYSSELTTHLAVGTTLGILVPTSISSAWSYYKRGSGNIVMFRKLALPVAGGALIGSLLAGNLSGSVLKAIFAVVALVIALNLFQKKHFVLGTKLPAKLKVWSVVGLIGLFSAMMGIGGGVFFYFLFDCLQLTHAKCCRNICKFRVDDSPSWSNWIYLQWIA